MRYMLQQIRSATVLATAVALAGCTSPLALSGGATRTTRPARAARRAHSGATPAAPPRTAESRRTGRRGRRRAPRPRLADAGGQSRGPAVPRHLRGLPLRATAGRRCGRRRSRACAAAPTRPRNDDSGRAGVETWVSELSVTPSGPPASATAVAVIPGGPGPPARLQATLEPQGHRWLVVAVGG